MYKVLIGKSFNSLPHLSNSVSSKVESDIGKMGWLLATATTATASH